MPFFVHFYFTIGTTLSFSCFFAMATKVVILAWSVMTSVTPPLHGDLRVVDIYLVVNL